MTAIDISLEQLRTCIGQELEFDGQHCRIIELLEDGPALVLACTSSSSVIQPNQYGDATRRVDQTRTINVLSADGETYHADFLKLNLGF
ncbi:MAG: hypothetical protein KKE76_13405 [Gammaproteobacteria bacterium]|nr:hypothetical protein [Gammaproteobacteria bacterium]